VTSLIRKGRNSGSRAVLRPIVPAGTTPGTNIRTGPWPNAAEDRVLMTRVARQDQRAYRELIDRHLGAILALARRMLRDDAEAEDIAQETFLRLWRSAETIDLGVQGLRPWLRRVASNLCIDRVRSAKRTVVVDEVPEGAQPASQTAGLSEKDLARRVDEALKALPERQRLALTLFNHEGMSQVEIGNLMGISDEAVESLLARARRSLRKSLENEWKGLLEKDSE